ncbi:MAG TPA: glycosyltransferase family 4 protein [Gemmatimonadaceae bacterium]|nr:glycosyltransferase family 4 protein [Gemmatimonadaceae bacterium]
MKIAFVHGHLHLGGIETLMLKLSRELRARGHELVILAGAGGNAELERELRRVAEVRFFPVSFVKAFPRLRAPHTDGLADVDVFFAFGSPQLLLAALIASRVAPSARVLAGVFSPWEYFPAHRSIRRDWRLADRIFARLPDENIIFMNEACRAEHRRALGRSFDASPVIPLPVDIAPLPWPRPIDRTRIASIGRLVAFKPYPFHMLGVLTELRRRGIDVTYDVYGDGPERARLEQAIADAGLDGRVRLRGTIDYSTIPTVLANAQGFVGVGTAALDAAALGVPTVVAYESDEPLSLGFFHDTAPAEFGDAASRGARYPLARMIDDLLALHGGAYARTAALGIAHAAQFGTDRIADQYLETMANARDCAHTFAPFDYAAAVATALIQKGLAVAGRRDPLSQRYFTRIAPPHAAASER